MKKRMIMKNRNDNNNNYAQINKHLGYQPGNISSFMVDFEDFLKRYLKNELTNENDIPEFYQKQIDKVKIPNESQFIAEALEVCFSQANEFREFQAFFAEENRAEEKIDSELIVQTIQQLKQNLATKKHEIDSIINELSHVAPNYITEISNTILGLFPDYAKNHLDSSLLLNFLLEDLEIITDKNQIIINSDLVRIRNNQTFPVKKIDKLIFLDEKNIITTKNYIPKKISKDENEETIPFVDIATSQKEAENSQRITSLKSNLKNAVMKYDELLIKIHQLENFNIASIKYTTDNLELESQIDLQFSLFELKKETVFAIINKKIEDETYGIKHIKKLMTVLKFLYQKKSQLLQKIRGKKITEETARLPETQKIQALIKRYARLATACGTFAEKNNIQTYSNTIPYTFLSTVTPKPEILATDLIDIKNAIFIGNKNRFLELFNFLTEKQQSTVNKNKQDSFYTTNFMVIYKIFEFVINHKSTFCDQNVTDKKISDFKNWLDTELRLATEYILEESSVGNSNFPQTQKSDFEILYLNFTRNKPTVSRKDFPEEAEILLRFPKDFKRILDNDSYFNNIEEDRARFEFKEVIKNAIKAAKSEREKQDFLKIDRKSESNCLVS